MKKPSVFLTAFLTLILFGVGTKTYANVFAHNVRITQETTGDPFDGSFEDGTGAAIHFTLSDIANSITVKIFDSNNNLVRSISGTDFPRGDTLVVWDGNDDSGNPVGKGDYSIAIETSQTGYTDYTEIHYEEIGLWTRGVTSVKTQNVKNFGFVYAASGGGYVTGLARHANDMSQWGDVPGNAFLTVNSPDPIGPDNFRYSAEADNEGNVLLARRSSSVPAIYSFNVDELNVTMLDSNAWGGSRPQGIAVAGGLSDGYLAVSTADGDVYGRNLDGSENYFNIPTDYLLSTSMGKDIFFSEYVEGSSSNKALEIFNPTNSVVDLSNYLILQNSNGGPLDEYVDTLSGTLNPGDVFVIANASANASILAEADLTGTGICYFNGDDARALAKFDPNGTTTIYNKDSSTVQVTIIDYIGTFPDDPGSSWDVAGVTGATKDHTIIRKSSVYSGNTDWAASAGTDSTNSEWIVLPKDSTRLGSHAMDTDMNPTFWDVTLGRDQQLYATYFNGANLYKPGVAAFDFTNYNGVPFTLDDAVWKAEVDSGLAHTLTYKFGDTPENDIIYFTMNDPPKYSGIGIWQISNFSDGTPDAPAQIWEDPGMNMSKYRSDVTVDAVGNVILFENSNEEIAMVSPPGGNTYEYVDNFDVIKVFSTESIADVKIDSDGDFAPDRLGEEVTVTGIVNSINVQASGGRFSYFIQDETGGINLFKFSSPDSIAYNVGDRIKVTGVVDQFRGTTELSLDSAQLANIELLGTGFELTPINLSLEDFYLSPERYESMLVRFDGIASDGTKSWPDSGKSGNINVTNGYSNITLRVDSDTDIDGKAEPTWPVNVTGVITQYTSSTPANNGYQISPMFYTDFIQNVDVSPNPHFFFTDSIHANVDGQVTEITDVNELYPLRWHPAVDLNNDPLLYQVIMIDEAGTETAMLSDSTGQDTVLTLTGQDILDLLNGADSAAYQITVMTTSQKLTEDMIASVDTITTSVIDKYTGVEKQLIPKKFFVDQNYPNPFNPTTIIRFGLPTERVVDLRIYDILGREVVTLVRNQLLKAGIHEYNFNAAEMASGTYIYRLISDNNVVTKKMMLVK